MKKSLVFILALVLIFTLGFSLVACQDTHCTEHVDSDSDGKCDTCGESVEAEKGDTGGGGGGNAATQTSLSRTAALPSTV